MMTVQSLPDRQREMVILRYYHGMSLDDAARTLGISRSTAFHRLQKALKCLRIQWEGGTEHD